VLTIRFLLRLAMLGWLVRDRSAPVCDAAPAIRETTMREIRTEVEIDAPAERVWSVLTAFDTYDGWNPFITHLEGELRPGSRLSVTMRPPSGRAITFRPSVTDVQPGRRFAWLGRLGVPGVFDGAHAHEVQPIDATHSRYVQSERFTGVLLPFVGKVLRRTEQGFRAMNAEVKARAERVPA